MYDFKAHHPEFDWSKYPTPKRSPFVVFIVTRNPGKPEQYKEPWVFDLDHTAGTFDHVLRYQTKGYELVGYGNLLPENPAVGVTTSANAMADEHAKIKAHIDQIINFKTNLHAKMQAELAEDRATIDARVQAEVQKLLAIRLEEERLAREEADKLLKGVASHVEPEKPTEKPAKKADTDKK